MKDLMSRIAELEHKHRGACIYFRGQSQDWGFDVKSKSPSTLLPSIYRKKCGGLRTPKDVIRCFDRLQCMDSIVFQEFPKGGARLSTSERARQWQRALVRWSVIQHYELCPDHGTPLLDVTQSLDVACAFAARSSSSTITQPQPTLYVLALPYPTAGISTHPEEDITNVRLLSACPPKAKRPRYQSAFAVLPDLIEPDLAGLTLEAGNGCELDFNSRLIGKFLLDLPKAENDRIAEVAATLFPSDDEIVEKTAELRTKLHSKFEPYRHLSDLIGELLGCVLELRKQWSLAQGPQAIAASSGNALGELLRTVREFDSDHRTPRWRGEGHAEVVARALRLRSEVIAYWRTNESEYPPFFEPEVAEEEIRPALEALNVALRRLQMRARESWSQSRDAA